ncbi:dehydrogenase [Pseudoxanthomonas kalamensis DSM 18571]|uniref:SDR family NAD(P)-dependent oxidoreductase n=1 Tax=Pseudoxanthomonas kalamensis TaxID=289483 RepID=UPI001390B026|nr:SDR family NAD(P)-dependent oxidoreductase [Pseudoxanthomonas kalamensis]KAF1710062.1 dehydrogenase [Pseudoxanthomonas kalamensis DSM 18571]
MSQPGYALITGASSGIGMEIAREYASRGVPLILTARRLDRLQRLADELRPAVPVEVIVADLSDPAAPAALAAEIGHRGLVVRILVNNAGYGVPGRYLRNDWKTHADFQQVMIASVAELSWRLLPSIRNAGDGRILNVASFAALVPAADGQTLYAPAKVWLLKFSEGLALENADRGVHVTALCPGFTRSEFHDVTGTRSKMRVSKSMWLDAAEVARYGIEACEKGRVLAVPGWRYRWLHALVKLLPHRATLALMARNSRKVRPLD